MDLFSTSIEIINNIYTVTIFIRDVTQEIKGYGDAKRDISNQLEHELVFVETFSDVCLDEEHGLLRKDSVRDSVKRDVKNCLEALNKALAAYRAEARKYAGITPDMAGVDGAAEQLEALKLKETGRAKFKESMKARYQVWRKKAAPLEWALFGHEEMVSLLATYREWTDRLRQTLSIILLLVGTPTMEFAASEQAARLGVQEVTERQIRVSSKPPEAYDVLKGDVDMTQGLSGGGLTTGVYTDETGFDEVQVVVESRSYDEALVLAVSERNHEEAQQLLEPLRELTWLLQSAQDTNLSKQDAQEGYRMHTLSCLGFIDEPFKNRSLILYRSPQSLLAKQELPSLYAFILNQKDTAPALGQRFLTARALAATLLTIHTSGWVHKNISSHSILLLSSSSASSDASEALPYLVGWDTARAIESGTSMRSSFELEPNLYRHSQRFGAPTHKFSIEHDIYALGVVLLEIGLWKTMSSIFARPLAKNPKIETSQQHALFTRVNGMIIDLATGADLKRAMGGKYAEIVRKCLVWSPSEKPDEVMDSTLNFRKYIVDALSVGCTL